jgi:hypothetical protein
VATAPVYHRGSGSAGNCRYSSHCFSSTTIFNLDIISGQIPGSRSEKKHARGGKITNFQGQNTPDNG